MQRVALTGVIGRPPSAGDATERISKVPRSIKKGPFVDLHLS
jgi:hypothetical protein